MSLAEIYFKQPCEFPEGVLPLHRLLELRRLRKLSIEVVSTYGDPRQPGLRCEMVQMGALAMTRSEEGSCQLQIDVIDCGSLYYLLDVSYEFLNKDIEAFERAWESMHDLLLPQCRRNVTIQYSKFDV